MSTASGIEPFDSLLADLFAAFQRSGRPELPPGRRAAIVSLLTRVMTDPHLYVAYTDRLLDERRRRGVEGQMLALSDPDIPEERIVADGFASLEDEILADLALSPEALQALEDRLYDKDAGIVPGPWFLAPPDDTIAAAHPAPTTSSSVSARSARLRWLGAAAALAASFMVGVLVGPRLLDKNRPDFALAQVDARGDAARGIEDVQLLVTNGGDARAFVTVVGLAPGNRRPVVFNRSGDTFLSVPPRDTAAVRNLPPEFDGVTSVVVVLTAVPAGEAVRVGLPAAANADRAEAVAEAIRASLAANNIRAETRVVSIPATKR